MRFIKNVATTGLLAAQAVGLNPTATAADPVTPKKLTSVTRVEPAVSDLFAARVEAEKAKTEAVDLFKSETWDNFVKKAEPHVVELLKAEIADAKKFGYKDSELIELIDYGMKKTIPSQVALGIKWLTVGINNSAVTSKDDIKRFYDAALEIGGFERYSSETEGRKAHFQFAVNYAFSKDSGFILKGLTQAVLDRKGKGLDENERKRVTDAIIDRHIPGFVDGTRAYFFHSTRD